MAPGQGLEPQFADPESAVLPLDEPGIGKLVPPAGVEPAMLARAAASETAVSPNSTTGA